MNASRECVWVVTSTHENDRETYVVGLYRTLEGAKRDTLEHERDYWPENIRHTIALHWDDVQDNLSEATGNYGERSYVAERHRLT